MIENEGNNFVLLKDLFSDSWNQNPEFSNYINELCSFGITKLYNEPANIQEERAQILSETQKLAFNNYKTFIKTADCCKEVFQDFQIVENHLEEMLIKLPKLHSSYTKFINEADHINLNRKLNTATLLKHPQLLEILELPQLMDTCVRNSYFDEALELAEYARRLAKRHSNIPIIANIVEEIKESMNTMLCQLLCQLRNELQLPTCLRVIGYLRRMNIFTELELRLKFLQIRSDWLNNILKGISSADPYHHISKTIELSRVHLFDIVTQYRAIFSDDEYSIGKDQDVDHSVLFYSWIVQKISEFLETLKADLSQGVGNRLDSLLGQCMYFGLSFGRVGLDFRNLMLPIFQKAALNIFTAAINSAELKLDESLKIYSFLGESLTIPTYLLTSQPANVVQAPSILLEFTPLATYCNDILTIFNDLRQCMPLNLVVEIRNILQKSLTHVANFLLTFHRVDESTFNEKELKLFNQLCYVFANHLLPFLNICLQRIFPPQQLALIAGVSTQHLTKIMLGVLNVEEIIEPIKHLIPQQKLEILTINDDINQCNQNEDVHQDENYLNSNAIDIDTSVKSNDFNVKNQEFLNSETY